MVESISLAARGLIRSFSVVLQLTELEHEHRNSSTDSEVEAEGRHGSHVVELVTTSQGKKNRIIAPSVGFRDAGKF